MCHTHTAARYFLAVTIETGSKGVVAARIMSTDNGSETTHKAKECITANEAGRRDDSGIENASQNA